MEQGEGELLPQHTQQHCLPRTIKFFCPSVSDLFRVQIVGPTIKRWELGKSLFILQDIIPTRPRLLTQPRSVWWVAAWCESLAVCNDRLDQVIELSDSQWHSLTSLPILLLWWHEKLLLLGTCAPVIETNTPPCHILKPAPPPPSQLNTAYFFEDLEPIMFPLSVWRRRF